MYSFADRATIYVRSGKAETDMSHFDARSMLQTEALMAETVEKAET